MDFGLVKQMDTRGTDVTLTAAQNMLVGSPLYMSPEAIRTPDAVDSRADLYAVGAVGYFLLTGQTVFEGATFVEICSQHLQAEPTPPSDRLGQPVPADLEALLLECLAKEPSDRPTSAQEVCDRLRACACAGAWSAEDATRWWDRREVSRRDTPAAPPLEPMAGSLAIDLSRRGLAADE